MECKHERIKSVNCRIFCISCGAELPAGFIPGKASTTAETPTEERETPKKATRKRTK